MKQIIQANEGILGILGKAKTASSGYRMSHYCVASPVEDGTLLFHTLTRELLLLSPEEYADAVGLPYVRDRWFVVPEELDEKKLVGLARWIQSSKQQPLGCITNYTILTTTDCNARCFYCYELGRARTPMSEETALKTADFIKDNCNDKPVRLSWFGGEPLYNYAVIDLICAKLRQYGVEYHSFMISNGYLFNDELARKAVSDWKLQRVQITLDGTEEVYNRCKAFVYREGSAYQVVTGNIARLLDQGIRVSVRMNMDFHNAGDLMTLSEELAERFGGKEGFMAYSHLIFDEKTAWDKRYPVEKWIELYDLRSKLEDKLRGLGIGNSTTARLRRWLPTTQCMADDESCVVITPDGGLGVCEHFSESELMGHLDSPGRDKAVIASFRQRCEEIPECATCFYYPQCIRLKKCPDLIPCIQPERDSLLSRVQNAMFNEYRIWKSGISQDVSQLPDQDLT